MMASMGQSQSAAEAGRWSLAIALGGLLALPLLWSLLSILGWSGAQFAESSKR
jgi:hypothetical protein